MVSLDSRHHSSTLLKILQTKSQCLCFLKHCLSVYVQRDAAEYFEKILCLTSLGAAEVSIYFFDSLKSSTYSLSDILSMLDTQTHQKIQLHVKMISTGFKKCSQNTQITPWWCADVLVIDICRIHKAK